MLTDKKTKPNSDHYYIERTLRRLQADSTNSGAPLEFPRTIALGDVLPSPSVDFLAADQSQRRMKKMGIGKSLRRRKGKMKMIVVGRRGGERGADAEGFAGKEADGVGGNGVG